MKTRFAFITISLGILLGVGTGCSSEDAMLRRAVKDPRTKLTEQAVSYFSKLLESGHLPGMANGELDRLETEPFPISEELQFPFHVTIKATKKMQSGIRYCYSFTKPDPHSVWHLDESWKVNAGGNKTKL
jgi:hypothetical protein